jgi:alpha-glucosidase/alpha-D-xyloside xylohydrolase
VSTRILALLGWLALFPGRVPAEEAAALRFAGEPVELAISEVGEGALRIEISPLDGDGRPRPRGPSTVLVPFPATEKLRARELAAETEVACGRLRVAVKPQPLAVSVRRADGTPVQELAFAAGEDGDIAFRVAAPLLGLGEGAQQFDRRGALYPMEPTWGGWNRPVLGSVVPSPYLIGSDGWALLAHRPEGRFDLRSSPGKFLPRWEARGKEPLDIFLIDAREPAAALAEYIRMTGRPVMPPKWALGYFQSHRTLAGPEEPLQIARTFREKRLPCDALIYLGTGYCPNGWNTGHGSVAFNPRAFDRPAEGLKSLHDLDFKVILHVNRAPRDLFGAGLAEESASPRHLRNYWARHRETFALGVDGWWPDDGDELPLEPRLARHRCYFEGSLQDRPGVRPWSLHRTGYAGVQRYGGWIWSGDIDGTWATLAAQVSVGLNHGLSLTPFWGTDTGGFYPTRELTGELYARWFQFSTFCPSFRSHGRTWKLRLPWGWNTGEPGPVEHNTGPDAGEFRNAAVEPIARRYLELRYRLLPYNYTLAREACDTGLPLMRALWLHYPDDPEAVKLGDQYLWGHDLLIAPVVAKGAAVRRVYLPAGAWYDWWTGERLAGGRWLERPVDLATLPIYARAGAVIPLDPVRQFTTERAGGATALRVHPGASGEFTLYDDDGVGLGYRDGSDPQTVWIRMRWDDGARTLTLEPDARMKAWPGGARRFAVEAAGSDAPAKEVEFRGERVAVSL